MKVRKRRNWRVRKRKRTTVYDFSWAFMLMDYLDEVSHPRMFRWLAAKSNTNIKEADLFNPPDDAVHFL
ncbi:hypothetical protein P3L10_017823 [Capsicum annuum]